VTTGSGCAGVGADLLELQRRYGNQYVMRLVQRLRQAGSAGTMHSAVHAVAANGVQGAGRRLPHADRVQQALGRHRLDAVRAYTDAAARAASRDLGAEAYTMGNKIAFASANPNLHTVAHEAAHVIQQRAGARPGNDRGSYFERRAEAAADAIVHGRSPAGFLSESGSRRHSLGVAPAIQAKVSVKEPQSLASYFLGSYWGSPQAPRALQTFKELEQFVSQHRISMKKNAAARYRHWHRALPNLLRVAGSRMISDEQGRVYDNTVTGAQDLADAVADEAYDPFGGRFGAGTGQALERSPAPTSLPSFIPTYSPREPGSSTSTFDYLSGLAESVPVPKVVGDYASGQARSKMKEQMPEQPVLKGLEAAVTGRAEALTRLPQDPRKAGEVLPWVDYYFNAGGAQDLQRTVDIAASKMSPDEARKFKEDFEKLKFDQEMNFAVSAGAGVLVGQVLGVIPHPAARVAKYAWQATGAAAANNKIADVSDKLEKFEQEHPAAFRVMQEHRDQKLGPLKAERQERWKKIKQDVTEHVSSPFG
jgi:Domain of unknown function (DUF4157)